MSYTEIRNIPVTYRRWFIDKIISDFESKNKEQPEYENRDQNTEESFMGLLGRESKFEKSFK